MIRIKTALLAGVAGLLLTGTVPVLAQDATTPPSTEASTPAAGAPASDASSMPMKHRRHRHHHRHYRHQKAMSAPTTNSGRAP